ncbi:hypothetical protein GJ744_002149 [Endocarpon pusillum]|uniref:Zn(2)-C6 fungal-type domain-containing protein n=1 Tax=Endocarpon pusillum TaxID=364733 RepID=A0A8H7ABM8_9EURO|nr:hypothetical protein GJ744_002149 [Endocarpon pusillum]
MPRKPHKKSRRGCKDCKRRHIKCDENRPVCVNCVTAGLQCAFFGEQQTLLSNDEATIVGSPGTSGSGSSTRNSGQCVGEGWRPQASHVPPPSPPPFSPAQQLHSPLNTTDPGLNLDYLELLHHFSTVTYQTLTPDPAQQQIWQLTAIQLSLSFPFLMHEILAIAALHLAQCRPERRSHYYTKATELQSHALNEFKQVREHVEASNCGAILIFACLLALHVLADPPRRQGLNFSDYLDHFLGCINLLRGVRHMVISDWWSYLYESELKPLLAVEEPEKPYNIPDECRDLAELTTNSDLGPTSIKAYDVAIERLQWNFAASALGEGTSSTIRFVMAWPVQLKDDYFELLNERRPEALIILAYYGALLHFYRASWAIGDSGAFLIRAVGAHTGPHWGRWMAWPDRVLKESSNVA